jgi:hypothetical protein
VERIDEELRNGIDDDLDGRIDEDCSSITTTWSVISNEDSPIENSGGGATSLR